MGASIGGNRSVRERLWAWTGGRAFVAVLAIVTTLCLPIGAAGAQDWAPELQSPAAEFFAADEALIIRIPAEAGAEIGELAVELDGFDVTALLRTDGGLLILDPPQALASGEHSLRLVQYRADGSILERGAWTFEVRDTAALRETSAAANAGVDLTYRFIDNDLADPPPRPGAQGAGDATARIADGPWSLDATANYFLNSQEDQTVDGRHLDVGEYLFTGRYDAAPTELDVRLGHHDLGADNLIMADFYRRGISIGLSQPDESLSVTAFALRSEPTLGIDNFTGVGDSDNRVQGVTVAARPIAALSENVQVTGTFYQGETRAIGAANGIAGEESEGTGGSLALDTFWLDRRLRLRGEAAFSRFDFDDDGDLPADNDLAYSFLGSYALIPGREADGKYVNWDIGVEHKQVGTFFASIANPFIVADRRTTSAFTNLTWGEVSAQAQAGFETSNVEALNALPTDRTLFATLGTTYTPAVTPDEDGDYGWLGQPTFGLSVTFTDGKQIDLPAGFLGTGGDYLAISTTLSAASYYGNWGWNLSQTVSSFEDRSGTSGDTMNYLTDLGLQFQPDAGLSINPYAQFSVFRDDGTNQDLDSFNLGIDIAADLIPDKVSATLNGSMNPTGGMGDTPDSYFVGGEVLWNAIPADVNQPGVALALTGSYQHTEDAAFDVPDDVVQVFGKVKLTLPLAY